VPLAAAGVMILLGALTLLGWAFDMPILRSLEPGGIPMLPNTACVFIIAAVSIVLVSRDTPQWRLAIALAGVVAAFGAIVFVERVTGISLGVDLLLFPNVVRRQPWLPPGRPAINSAVAFVSLGAALCAVRHRRANGRSLAELLALPGTIAVALALIGHLYGVTELYSFGPFTGMSLPTALAFTAFAVAVYFARADFTLPLHLRSNHGDGIIVRTQLPITIGLSVGLGFLWLEARRVGLIDRETGVSLFVLAIAVISVALVLSYARVLRRMGTEREDLLHLERRAREEAQTANRAKTEFIRTMSHELRTPLNAIAGYTELLELGLRGPLTEKQKEDLTRIRQSQQLLLVLVEDVLAFAKLEAGQMQFVVADIDLQSAVGLAVSFVQPQFEKKGLALIETRADENVIVRADAAKLHQILANLLSNALKFTAPGGTVTVTFGATPDGGCVRVTDTGIGIPEDMLEKIFEPFVQVDMGLTRAAGGTGLGLAISRDLAKKMGGDLVVQSTVGLGSSFTLTLRGPAPPLARTANTAAGERGRGREPALRAS
jgi:signal transduction histidine kinase